MWIDSHAHLFDVSNEKLADLIKTSESAGISRIINTAVSIDTARIVLDQCSQYPQNLKAALGISPFDITDQDSNWEQELENLLDHASVVAVGEIGLDGTNPRYPSLEEQLPFFRRQILIAQKKGIPAVVHSRGMEKRVAQLCRELNAVKVVFHCFTGDREALDCIIENGYYISLSGIVTYKNAQIRSLLPFIPLNRLLIETDSPYLAPVPLRGKQNEPSFLIHTARLISEELSIEPDNLSQALAANCSHLFNLENL